MLIIAAVFAFVVRLFRQPLIPAYILTGILIDNYNSFNPAWLLRAGLGGIAFFLIIFALRRNLSR